MESQRVHILLQKYFDAETSIDEENELITYFSSENVDESLKMYVPMFSGMKELSVEKNADLEDDLMNYILESEHREKLKYRRMWQLVSGVAASVIVVMLAVNFYTSRTQWSDTFTDPDRAYVEASKTLEFVAGKYNKGLAQLRPVKKLEEAASPLQTGFSMLNKGFEHFKTTEKSELTIKNE
jgi:hypothetical protein